MAIAAVKAVAKRLNIKIKPIVGGTLFGPTLAFSFDYEVEFEVEKLWEVLDSALVSAAHPG